MSTRQPRFVVLRHDVGPRDVLNRTAEPHFDWMLEFDGTLRTWASAPQSRFDQSFDIACDALADHRLAYLDYEGAVTGDRGTVTRVLVGSYRLMEADEDRFAAALCWQQGTESAEALFYRSFADERSRVDESRDCWRLRFLPGRKETKR